MIKFEKNEVDKLFSGKSVPIKNSPLNRLGFFLKSFALSFLIFGMICLSLLFFVVNDLQTNIIENGHTSENSNSPLNFQNLSKTIAQLGDLTFSDDHSQLTDEDGWINILLIGLPSKDFPGQLLTDSILVASVNPELERGVIISIPRDLAVQLDSGRTVKINSVYARHDAGSEGTQALMNKLEEVLGLNINYYLRLDFVGFEKFIDSLNGIDVEVMEDIYDPKYPTPGYGTEVFEINKGFHHLNGQDTLKYVRTRHTSENDFGRSKRQQQVFTLVYQKFKDKGDLLSFGFNRELFSLLKDHVRTNITISEAKDIYQLGKEINFDEFLGVIIDNRESGLLISKQTAGLGYHLKPKEGDYEAIHAYVEEKMGI